MRNIEDLVKTLPPKARQEVRKFVRSLIDKQGRRGARAKVEAHKHTPRPKRPLKLDWRGALRDLREKYTSVELQHKILDWWTD
jgi:hypothetical protein